MGIRVSEVSDSINCYYCKRKFKKEEIIENCCSECFSEFPINHLIQLQNVNIMHTIILNLYFKHEFSALEISKELKINYNTVRTVISRQKKLPKPYLSLNYLKTFINVGLSYLEKRVIGQ